MATGREQAPSSGVDGVGGVDVYGKGGAKLDGAVWHIWQTQASNGWSDWVPANPPAGTQGAAPEVRASGDGRLELFVVGGDGSLWHSWQTQASNGWSDWVSHGQP